MTEFNPLLGLVKKNWPDFLLAGFSRPATSRNLCDVIKIENWAEGLGLLKNFTRKLCTFLQ
jgi:hypothetical protein